jgi:DNA-binding response OmpR family regulator
MPKMDGISVLRKLRSKNEWGKTVPVFILTNLSSADDKINNDVVELTPTYYIEKNNIIIDDLLGKIKDVIK